MRAFVFTDASLASEAGRFVWLEIDTENPKNAAVRKRLNVQALPTYYVLDPVDQHVMLRWVGGASVDQLHHLLGEATAMRRAPASAADSMLVRADRLYGETKSAEAADAYREAVEAAPEGWPSYGRAVESWLFALSDAQRYAEAARLAHAALPELRHTVSAVNVAASGLSAALELPKDDAQRATYVSEFERATREILADPSLTLAGDDRSGAMISLLDARHAADDSVGARRVAQEWSDMLDAEAAKAKTPEERTVYDSHRLSAYMELGQPERAIPMLEQSQRDFPKDYNPPARLAIAYQAMQRWDEALAASDRALARAYGPRKLRIYQTRADLSAARGDAPAARKTLEQALAEAEAMPEGQRSEATIASLKKKLDAMRQ